MASLVLASAAPELCGAAPSPLHLYVFLAFFDVSDKIFGIFENLPPGGVPLVPPIPRPLPRIFIQRGTCQNRPCIDIKNFLSEIQHSEMRRVYHCASQHSKANIDALFVFPRIDKKTSSRFSFIYSAGCLNCFDFQSTCCSRY